MFDDKTFTQDMLSNPTKLAKAVIDGMQSSDTKNIVTMNDPNNGFTMMLLANVSIFSKFSEKVDSVCSFLYPQRARNAEQLYPRLSQFDYINLMASPATLPFVFAMSKDWVVQNSVYYDSNYDKIEIPATSYFTMGGIIYSMYHPIQILSNRNTGAVTAFYDVDQASDLNTLASNMLLDVQQFTQNGINYFQILFNMYQFERKVSEYTVGVEQGFIKTLSYQDQFYAVKVYTQNNLGVWTELAYSLSQMYYDYQKPTAVLSLLTDINQIKIQIPQIYFDNRQVSQNVKIELYTTKGKVNYSLSLADVNSITANFDTSSSVYAAPLAQMPTWDIKPITLEVAGGSNVKSYSEIREAVVNQRLYDRVAVTTPEIIEAGKKAGFDLTRVVDDLTERMYFASNVLTDSNGLVVPTFAGNILVADQSLNGDPSTILKYTDGYYTILPTTTFTITNNSLTCVPMTNGQVATMSQMTNAQLVKELNKGTYVRQPFHITLTTAPKSPQAYVYNLLSPAMTSLKFVTENAHSAPQISAIACKVVHLNNGTGGYQILMDMVRSSNIINEPFSSFNVTLLCRTKTGSFVYLPAQYVSTKSNGVDIWTVSMATTYHITSDDSITVKMYDASDIFGDVEIPLNQTFTLLTSFDRNFDPTVPIDPSLNTLLPPSLQTSVVAMTQQTMVISLGHNLSSQIYSGVNTSWGNDVYQTADTTTYYHTDIPIFQTKPTGVINTRVNPTTQAIEVVLLNAQGSVPATKQDLLYSTTLDCPIPTNGSTTAITFNDVTGLLVGMKCRGLNIPTNTVIETIVGNVVTLSKKITGVIPANTTITFTNPYILTTTTAQQTAVDKLTIASTAELLVGQSVFGFDVPIGAKVKAILNATDFTITLSTTVAVAAFTVLTIVNNTAPGVVKTKHGDIVTDPTGSPIVIKDAQNQYLIPSILFDGRLFASQNPNDQQIVTTISESLQNYANQISTIDAGLIEDSNVFYKPARTMGYAKFGIGGGKTLDMLLELSFTVTVYVDVAIYNTQPLLSTISETIVSIINKSLQNSILSVSDITEVIREQLGNNIAAVEMGDISGIEGLRLVSLETSEATPCIENVLSISSDGTIERSPNIAITYLPKPDTSKTAAIAAL